MDAEPQRVWEAVVAAMGAGSSRIARLFGAAVGVEDGQVRGSLEEPGSTIVGFHVTRSARPRELVLEGRHRFARYSLAFAIDELGPGRSRLRAITHAEFPGARGRLYRALVIGTRGHVVATRLMLRRVRMLAEAG